jgi:hypothetical protein
MGIGSRSAAIFLDAEVAGKAMSADVDLVPHRRLLISNDSDCQDFGSSQFTSLMSNWQVHGNVYSEESRALCKDTVV